jgi:hypothetical protein
MNISKTLYVEYLSALPDYTLNIQSHHHRQFQHHHYHPTPPLSKLPSFLISNATADQHKIKPDQAEN